MTVNYFTSPPFDEVVRVASSAAFPNQDANFIYLDDKVEYKLSPNFVGNIEKPIICEPGGACYLHSTALDQLTVTYLGSSSFITAHDSFITIEKMGIDCPNAMAFDVSDSAGATKKFICQNVQVLRSAKAGRFENMFLVEFFNSGFFDTDQGLELVGQNWLAFSVDRLNISSTRTDFVAVDFGTAVIPVNEASKLLCFGPAGSIGLRGLADSANVPVGQIAVYSGCKFDSELQRMTPLSGISRTDIRWKFENSPPIADSQTVADSYLIGGSEDVIVGAADTFYEIGVPTSPGVTFESDVEEKFRVEPNGSITYIGEQPFALTPRCLCTVDASGNSEIEARLAINWTAGDTGLEKSKSSTQNSSPTTLKCQALVTMMTNDNINIIYKNSTNGNITVSSQNLIVKI